MPKINSLLTKHNSLIDIIALRLEQSSFHNYKLSKNIVYDSSEIDLLAIERNKILIFEIKCNDRNKCVEKSRKQLRKHYNYIRSLNKKSDIYLFEVYGYKGSLDYFVRRYTP